MKFPFRINAKGKLVKSREALRREALERAKWAIKYGKEGVDYYV